MALQKKLLVSAGTISILLSIYFLYLTLEWPLSMSLVPLRVVTARISSFGSKGPPEGENYTHQRLHPTPITLTPTATERPKLAQNKTRDVSESKSVTPTAARSTRPAGPTEPPFIGEAYMSGDAPQQTDCPDTIRGRIKTSEFGSRFLERIPVVQWSKHATPEQYQRLKQYPGTHGWGGINYDTLVDTLSVLNSSANRQMLDDWEARRTKSACSRCAVVGNGGILKNSQKGKEIDSHHYVFSPLKYFGKDVSAAKLKMFHPDFIRYLRNRFLRSSTLKTRYKDIYRPSTGAAMLLAALHSCDQVSAYGFMTPDYSKYSDHYYDSTYHPVGFFINHDLRMEMALWQQLHHAGLIRLYMRD